MALFKKLFKQWRGAEDAARVDRPASGATPYWASSMETADWQLFLRLVQDYFHREGIDVTIQGGAAIVEHGTPNWLPGLQLGLTNIAQICQQNETSMWKEIIAEHFNNVREMMAEERELEQQAHNFSAVSDLLAVRLWPDDLDVLCSEGPVYRQDLEGTVSALVFDLPRSIPYVTVNHVAQWNKEIEELFEIALCNVRSKNAPEISKQDLGNDIEVTLFSGDSFFVATHALLLQWYPSCLGTHGALVGVPHRHAVICYPIEDINVVKAVNKMIPPISRMYEQGPGSVSPRLYWFHNGEFTSIPYSFGRNEFSIAPPAKFVELLNGLAELASA